ncbi:MAG: hypothetical protein J7K68_02190 [Candidatus Diapherotrites archaeon]|nr:hypothetical protein [Candidatus Diapherotrites archaeon]
MQLSDFFSFKDLVRTALIGSALFFFIGSIYGVFLHAQYSSQVNQVKQDLLQISELMNAKATQAYTENQGELSRQYKTVADRAKQLANDIEAPPVTPYSYTYLNYWIASAAFTKLRLDPSILGLPNKTVAVFKALDNEEVLGAKGWWNRDEFRGFSLQKGEYVQFLEKPPELHSYFWTFYVFVLLIAIGTIFISVKEHYEIPVLPELIYGAFMPVLFFVVFTIASMLSLFRIIKFLDPSQVNMMVSLLAFVIMSVLSAFGALIAAILRMKTKKARE